jgi:GT2 family glycosyltransferase
LHVNGEFICFLDADDYFKPELCETCLTTARRDDADIVEFGWLLYIDNKHIFHGPEREETFSGNGGWAMLNIPYTSHLIWNKFYKADLIRKSGRPLLPELQYGEDTEWNISLSPHIKNFTKIPNALIVHNYYPSSLSSTAPPVRITLSFIRRLQTLIEIAYSTGNQNLKDAACRLIKDYLSKTDERISNIGTEASLPV